MRGTAQAAVLASTLTLAGCSSGGGFGGVYGLPLPGGADLGDAVQYGAGVAFALNERSSLSASFTQRFVAATHLRPNGGDWQKVIGSNANVALLNFGATFAITDKVALLGSVSVGMTADAPDMVVSLMLPIRF